MTTGLGFVLPNAWQWLPLKFATSYLSRGTTPDYVDEGPIRAIGQAANQPHGLDWERTRFHSFEGDPKHLKGHLKPGDVLINSTGTGTLGRIGYFSHGPDNTPCMADSHITIARADRDVHSRYLHYWLGSRPFSEFIYSALIVGATNQIELNREKLAAAPIIVPPFDEQRRIADFLDAETAKADQLMAQRAAHRALLEVRITSLLVRSVFDDSELWTRTRLKYLFSSVRNGLWGNDPVGVSDDVTCVRVADFQRDSYRADPGAPTLRSIPEGAVKDHSLQPGDVLLEKSGGGEQSPVGFAVTFNGTARSVCSNFVAALRPTEGVDPRFSCLVLAAFYRSGRNVPFIKQATGIQNLDGGAYLAQEVRVPDERQQIDAARRFDHELNQVLALQSSIDRQLALLTERRQALITAAATGQIDVTTARGVTT